MMIVNVHEAKTHLSRLMEKAHNGEEIILAKAGKPYARLVPLEKEKTRKPGSCRGRTGYALLEPLTEKELQDWEQ